jgi:hypothetical protein
VEERNSYSLIEVTGGKRTVSSHIPKWEKYMKIEGKTKGGTEVTRRRGRRRRKLLDDLKERRGYSHLKKEALDCTMWRARFGKGFGTVV